MISLAWDSTTFIAPADRRNESLIAGLLLGGRGSRARVRRSEAVAGRECQGEKDPIHGDCTCRDPDDKNDDDCPLHSFVSTHGEVQVIETAWGPVQLEDEP